MYKNYIRFRLNYAVYLTTTCMNIKINKLEQLRHFSNTIRNENENATAIISVFLHKC